MEILKNIFSKLTPWTIDPLQSPSSENVVPNTSSTQNFTEIQTLSPPNQLNSYTLCVDYPSDLENELCLPWTENPLQSIESANYMESTPSAKNINNVQTHLTTNKLKSYNPNINNQIDIYNTSLVPLPLDSLQLIESPNLLSDISYTQNISEFHILLPIQFKSYSTKINSQEDIDDELVLPLSYQYMFDKRTSPWEMKDWDQDDLNTFNIQPEKIDRLYHIVADDEDQNFRSWELCCRLDHKGEKYFVEMYANCDYTGFDCQGGGHICITKLADFFLNNMVTNDQNPEQIYMALLEDGYDVQEPDPLHKIHPKFCNNSPMLKYLFHNAIF